MTIFCSLFFFLVVHSFVEKKSSIWWNTIFFLFFLFTKKIRNTLNMYALKKKARKKRRNKRNRAMNCDKRRDMYIHIFNYVGVFACEFLCAWILISLLLFNNESLLFLNLVTISTEYSQVLSLILRYWYDLLRLLKYIFHRYIKLMNYLVWDFS